MRKPTDSQSVQKFEQIEHLHTYIEEGRTRQDATQRLAHIACTTYVLCTSRKRKKTHGDKYQSRRLRDLQVHTGCIRLFTPETTDVYSSMVPEHHKLSFMWHAMMFAGMQGLDARSDQRQDVRSGANARSGGGGGHDLKQLHSAHAHGDLGPCGHFGGSDRRGRRPIRYRSTRSHCSRLESHRASRQGRASTGTGNGE